MTTRDRLPPPGPHSPRANFIDGPHGLAHVPDLMAPDHDAALRVGFLADLDGADDPGPEPLPKPNPAWAAPAKFERRRLR